MTPHTSNTILRASVRPSSSSIRDLFLALSIWWHNIQLIYVEALGRGGRQTDKLMDTTPLILGSRPTIPYEADIVARIKPQDTQFVAATSLPA